MARSNKAPVRTDGVKRVHWKEPELMMVVPKVVDLITGNPKLTLGKAFMQAQHVLESSRRRAPSLEKVAEGLYGKLVEKEIARRQREAASEVKEGGEIVLTPYTPQEASAPQQSEVSATVQTPAPEAQISPTVQPPELKFSDMDHTSLMDAVTDNLAEQFRRMLRQKLDAVHREVLVEQVGRGARIIGEIPPAPAPLEPKETREMQLMSGHQDPKVGQKLMQLMGKVKVALVGNVAHDHKYFNRIREGLEEGYDFIEVNRLGDTPKTAKCQVVIMSGTAPNRVQTAVKTIAPNAKYFTGKASTFINHTLKTEWENFREARPTTP